MIDEDRRDRETSGRYLYSSTSWPLRLSLSLTRPRPPRGRCAPPRQSCLFQVIWQDWPVATTSRQLAPRRTTSVPGALASQSSFIETFVPESNNLSESQHRWASARFQPNTCKLSSLSFPSEVPVSTRTIARNLTPFNDDKDHS